MTSRTAGVYQERLIRRVETVVLELMDAEGLIVTEYGEPGMLRDFQTISEEIDRLMSRLDAKGQANMARRMVVAFGEPPMDSCTNEYFYAKYPPYATAQARDRALANGRFRQVVQVQWPSEESNASGSC